MTNIARPYEVYAPLSKDQVPVYAWTKGVPFEDSALDQIRNTARMPFIYKHLAIMPDVHAGIGSTVGSVVVTKGAIIPACVGVDLGCGMMAVKTSLRADQLPDNLAGLRSSIEGAVPHGRTDNGGRNDKGVWRSREIPQIVEARFADLKDRIVSPVFKHYFLNDPSVERALSQLGTLGTGNHFIEICLDESDNVWVMLHSGSRGIGNKIASHFIALAKKEMEAWFIHLPDKDLAYLATGSVHYGEYLNAVEWAQQYAEANRQIMREIVMTVLRSWATGAGLPEITLTETAVNCHHNYVSHEIHFGDRVIVTRKGAVSAQAGELGIIPGSMGAKSFIVRGKGNKESFCSCSHGAGRRMSRTEAKKVFTLEDHAAATAGVECRKDSEVIDETPAAYKSIDDVMRAQESLVEVVHTLKQIVCVKG